MTSDGSPIIRLQHALRAGDPLRVGGVAAELPYIPLPDALSILELIEAQDEAHFEPAAVRWVGRLALEAPGLTLSQLHLAIEGLDGLPDEEAKATLRAFARRARAAAEVARPLFAPRRGDARRSPRHAWDRDVAPPRPGHDSQSRPPWPSRLGEATWPGKRCRRQVPVCLSELPPAVEALPATALQLQVLHRPLGALVALPDFEIAAVALDSRPSLS